MSKKNFYEKFGEGGEEPTRSDQCEAHGEATEPIAT